MPIDGIAVAVDDSDTGVYECSECGKHFSIIDGQFGNPFNRFRRRERTGGQDSAKPSAPSDAEANQAYDVSSDFERLKDRVSKRQV